MLFFLLHADSTKASCVDNFPKIFSHLCINFNWFYLVLSVENVIHKRSTTYEACKETDAMDEQEGDEESDNENQHHTNRACHKLTTLYILQQNLFLDNKIKADELR